ncbi:3-oxoacyl-ACP synthase III family protein [Streptomyces sp.]|uniref:3-oxoacyl-ACP synthase III family protein n=1 Tax=Streptomyces sp. TaxID=1931 RepID=UPI002F3E7B62
MSSIGILSTGSYLPDRVITNADLAATAGVTPEWIESRTAIVERRRAASGEATSDLAAAAAQRAMDAAGLVPAEIDFIVVATSTPDHPQPATASIVQHLIGATTAAAVDVNAVCSGFVYALAMAQGLLSVRAGGGYGLVIGADIYSRILDYTDRKTAILFGDGAGAVVLGPVAEGTGIIGTTLRGHGAAHELISVPAGGSRTPSSESTVREGGHYFRMDGRGVRDFVNAQLPGAVSELLKECAIDPIDVKHMVPHQANGMMLRDLWKDLDLPSATLQLTVERYANTGSASIPITLDAAHRAGALSPGDNILLAGFGGGMNLGLAMCQWSVPSFQEAGLN